MAKKRVFVSFDYGNDRHYKFLLERGMRIKISNFSLLIERLARLTVGMLVE